MSGSAAHLVVVEDADDATHEGLVDGLRRRVAGSYELDPWGLDDDVTRVAGRLATLRWSTAVVGIEHLPSEGPALLVANRRLGWSEPAVVAMSVLREAGRIVRPVGGVGFDPVAGFLGRLGVLPARGDEVTAALRADNLVLVPTRREPVRNRPGHLPIELVAAGLAADVPLVPVAVIGWEFGRNWTVRVGEPIDVARGPRTRRSDRIDPRAVGAAAVAISAALDELMSQGHHRDLKHRMLSLVPGSDDASGGGDRDDRGCDKPGAGRGHHDPSGGA